MSLTTTYYNKNAEFRNVLKSLNAVKDGTPRKLIFPHIRFCNLKAKRDWIARQELTLRLLNRVIERLASKIYISKAA